MSYLDIVFGNSRGQVGNDEFSLASFLRRVAFADVLNGLKGRNSTSLEQYNLGFMTFERHKIEQQQQKK